MTRYFVNCTSTSPDESHDRVKAYGRVLTVKLHGAPQDGWVYGLAEFEPNDIEDAERE